MVDPIEFVPGYVSPLTDKQHAQIGRIAVLWGQIEHYVEEIIPRVTGLTWDELEAIGITDRPIASKVNYLSKVIGRLGETPFHARIKDFCGLIHETKTDRNHIFHGIWGWRADSSNKSVKPAARRTRTPGQPLLATKLSAVEKKLCRCSRIGADIMMEFMREPFRVKHIRFFHFADIEHPKWLEEWTERNSWDDALLEPNSKDGQLPRLRSPFPEK